eukprot:6208740-Pleurochrysis_carterae.AAC.3
MRSFVTGTNDNKLTRPVQADVGSILPRTCVGANVRALSFVRARVRVRARARARAHVHARAVAHADALAHTSHACALAHARAKTCECMRTRVRNGTSGLKVKCLHS